MMKFHLDFNIPALPEPMDHRQSMMLIGSCFTENIGGRLREYKFNVLENPHGILFNPVSVADAITACIERREFTEGDLFLLNEGWHSWKHHSRFSATTPGSSLQKINSSISSAHEFIRSADYMMITLGSAWVYILTELAPGGIPGTVAANNHKAPASWFNRRLLHYEEVVQVLDNLIHRLFHFNSRLQIIFTISPVRHLREGVVANNRSKAVLIQAVHHLADKFNRLHYFPAYELVIDDLRDYRFYTEDLVHPNYAATQYVWEKFTQSCISRESQKIMEEIASINLAYRHRPFHSASAAHRGFLKSYHERTVDLLQRYPYLDLRKELDYFAAAPEN